MLCNHSHNRYHFQDFLRQNNTGKLLWQLFGVEAATLCLFGIAEHEEIMWNAFKCAGILNVFGSEVSYVHRQISKSMELKLQIVQCSHCNDLY